MNLENYKFRIDQLWDERYHKNTYAFSLLKTLFHTPLITEKHFRCVLHDNAQQSFRNILQFPSKFWQ